jgi:hypothetical protein
MGTNILVSSPDRTGTAHFHFSLNRTRALIKYGFWIGDYHDFIVQDVLIALNHLIIAMMAAGIKLLIEFEDWAHNEETPGAMGNAIHFRNGLEAKTGLDWHLDIDS